MLFVIIIATEYNAAWTWEIPNPVQSDLNRSWLSVSLNRSSA